MAESTEREAARKLLSGRGARIRIALGGAVILGVGAWLTPPAAQTPIATLEERAAPLLEEQVQRTEAARTFTGVQDVIGRVRDQIVAIPAVPAVDPRARNDFANPPPGEGDVRGYGVVVADAYVLTHEAALDGRLSLAITAGGQPLNARVAAFEPDTGLVLLAIDPVVPDTSIALRREPVAAGSLVVGIGRAASGDTAIPAFITTVRQDWYGLGASPASIPPGLPLFTLTGELFAIAVPNTSPGAVPVGTAAERLLARAAAGERRLALGVGLQPAADVAPAIFGERGMIVTDVLEGGPADVAELQVGDVLLAIDDGEVDSIDAVTAALTSTETTAPRRVRFTRGGRSRDTAIVPALAYEVATLGRRRQPRPDAVEARILFDAATLQEAGIPPTARVMAIGGRPVLSRAQAQRARRAARGPLPVLLRDNDLQYFVALAASR